MQEGRTVLRNENIVSNWNDSLTEYLVASSNIINVLLLHEFVLGHVHLREDHAEGGIAIKFEYYNLKPHKANIQV